MTVVSRLYRSVAVLSTILVAVGVISFGGGWINATQAPVSADALCDAMRARFGPGYPCISIPTNTFTPTAPTAAPTTTDANGQPNTGGPQVGSNIGPGPGEGNGTPIVPVPTRSMQGVPATPPAAVPTAPSVAVPNQQPAVPAPTQRPARQPAAQLPYGSDGDCGSDTLPTVVRGDNRTPEEQEAYDRLRGGTGEYDKRREAIANEIRDGKWPGYSVSDTWEMDHIVSIDRLVRTPGFLDLSQSDQDKVANAPTNTRPLRESWNKSKGNKSYAQWPDRTPTGRIDAPSESNWKKLCEEESGATGAILRAIAKDSGGGNADNRADTGNGDNQAQSGSGSGGSEQLTRTVEPQQQQNAEPTQQPDEQPTYEPTEQPTYQPTELPTQQPAEPQPTTQTTLPMPPRLPTTSAPSTPPTFNLPGVTATAKDPSTWEKVTDKVGDTGRAGLRVGGAVAEAGVDSASDAANGVADGLQGAANSNSGVGADSGVGAGLAGAGPILGTMLAW